MVRHGSRMWCAALAVLVGPQLGLAQTSRLVQADGHRLEIVELGEGSPTVVVEAGLGADWHEWSAIMNQLATMTKVVGYARAGYSRSDAVDHPRTAQEVAGDLHALLRNANVPGPYLLLGHSYGGILVRTFASSYPDEVAGMLLVEPSHPAQLKEFVRRWPEWQGVFERQRQGMREAEGEPGQMDAETLWSILAAGSLPAADSVPDVPTTIITSVRVNPDAPMGPSTADGRAIWRHLHDRYFEGVTQGAHIVTTRSGHNVQADEPELIVDAVRQLLAWVRR